MSRSHAPADLSPATRAQPPGWRDPRLWVGVAIVAASTVGGARIVGAADDTVSVWAAARDLAPGDTVVAEDLVPVRVRFEDPAGQQRYLATGDRLPADLHLLRGLGAGELVPAGALGSATDDTVTLSLAFPPELVPSEVAAGSRVDLWVVGADRRGAEDTEAVLTDVVVIDAPSAADPLGSPSGGRQLVLAVPEGESGALAEVLAASADGRVRVLGRS